MIIGISGEAGHGKNEVARLIAQMYSAQFVITGSKIIKTDFHDKFEERAFADPLKRVCSALTNYPLEVFYDRTKKDKIIPGFGITMRELLQKVGTALRTIDDKIFVKSTIARIKPNNNILFTDVRFHIEKDAVNLLDGINIKVVRFVDGKRYVDASLDTEEKKNHPSETELGAVHFDYFINNTEGLGELKHKVRLFMIEVGLLIE